MGRVGLAGSVGLGLGLVLVLALVEAMTSAGLLLLQCLLVLVCITITQNFKLMQLKLREWSEGVRKIQFNQHKCSKEHYLNQLELV